MKKLFFCLFCSLIICFALINAEAQRKPVGKVEAALPQSQKTYHPIDIEPSPALQTLLNNAVGETINKFLPKNMKSDYVAATLIDLRDPNNLKMANFRGDEKIYPASVVKMFYMAALHRWLEDGKVKITPELERGLKDMIVDSSNEATQYILDVLTDTSSGGELPPKEFKVWSYKRNAVNRYFGSLGYERINVNQ